MHIIKFGALLIAAASLTACATITRGTTEIFVVETTPSAAQVKISNGMECEATPCSFKVPRKGAFYVTISKDGYETSTHNIETAVSGGGGTAMAGNVLVGGLIGAGVDASSGAMLDHKPNPLVVTMMKLAESTEKAADLIADTVENVSEAVAAATEEAETMVDETVEEAVEEDIEESVEDATEEVLEETTT